MIIPSIISIISGILLVWMVTSWIVMSFQEWITSRMRWRANMLEATIRNMISDQALADQFYNHPLIRSLYSGKNSSDKPSYIPASQFSQVLMDIVQNASSEAALIQYYLYKLRWKVAHLSKKQRAQAQQRLNIVLALARRAIVSPTELSGQENALSELRSALVKMGEDFAELKQPIDGILSTISVQREQIQNAIQSTIQTSGINGTLDNPYKLGLVALSITHPRLKQTLGAIFGELALSNTATETAQVRAKQNLEEWFNNSMDRLTGWYRRRAQILAYVLSFSIVLLLNIDTVQITRFFWNDIHGRESVSQIAPALIGPAENTEGISAEAYLYTAENLYYLLPIGWIGLPAGLESQQKSLCTTAVPILYLAGQCYPLNAPAAEDTLAWVWKLAGLIVTSIAAAQGAPLWFDLLKKVINIRIAGANPIEVNRAAG